ncbi:DUF3653 domain-containing protein [Luteimonas fraxinea]|uniref:Phage protein n=1 Tax=Luteimonas fraxinea TaxID=2901869 RepID=A0ABS8UAL7_9GAMM|nr:DUF3653 domain-containing protein [Luteimonas fraxinea]MCD9096523.1 phage protein [Luteimonas fraxinea]
MPTCRHCEAESPTEHYDRIVHNRCSLHGPWRGWRLAGRDLVSPEGTRLTPERLKGLAFRLEAEERLQRARARNASRKATAVRRELVKVVVVDLDDWRRRHFGGSAA